MRNRVTARMRKAESARIGIGTIKTAEINAANTGVNTAEMVIKEMVTRETMTAGNAPFTGIRNSAITGRGVFLTRIVVILMQTKQKSFSTSKHMGPTRFTGTSTRTDPKRMGGGATTVRGAVSRVAAGVAAGEEGTKVGADIRAAGGEAEGVTRILGTTNKRINKGATFKTTSNNKATTMMAVIIMAQEATTQDLPGDKVKPAGATNRPPNQEIK